MFGCKNINYAKCVYMVIFVMDFCCCCCCAHKIYNFICMYVECGAGANNSVCALSMLDPCGICQIVCILYYVAHTFTTSCYALYLGGVRKICTYFHDEEFRICYMQLYTGKYTYRYIAHTVTLNVKQKYVNIGTVTCSGLFPPHHFICKSKQFPCIVLFPSLLHLFRRGITFYSKPKYPNPKVGQ